MNEYISYVFGRNYRFVVHLHNRIIYIMLIDIIFNHSKNRQKNKAIGGREHLSRSVVKAISWRLLGTLDTIMIAFFITGTLGQALSIGLIEWVTKIILYFLHERLWNRIQWGQTTPSKK